MSEYAELLRALEDPIEPPSFAGFEAAAAIRALVADRDSWERQASDRVNDALQFALERDAARAECDRLRELLAESRDDVAEVARQQVKRRWVEYYAELLDRIDRALQPPADVVGEPVPHVVEEARDQAAELGRGQSVDEGDARRER